MLVEPECVACVRVLKTAQRLREVGVLGSLIVLDRCTDPDACNEYGAVIFPAVFINGHLAFYGEFSQEEAVRFAQQSS